jgi:lipoate-protein ligase A
MNYLDLTLPTPAQNLACDEALLDWCEDENRGEFLRFWEPREFFIVVGYANKVAQEVNAKACAASGIPIYRRCSGGGAVLQGPGCLNYSLILKIAASGRLRSVASANRFIMERNRAALAASLTRIADANSQSPIANSQQHPASRIEVRGHTDLAVGGLKLSGNAQRRRKRCLLFHGTFLLRFDIPLIERILPMPSKQPDYRRHRTHSAFLTNLPVSADSVKRALREAWRAEEWVGTLPHERIDSLARDRYVTKEWNLKF